MDSWYIVLALVAAVTLFGVDALQYHAEDKKTRKWWKH